MALLFKTFVYIAGAFMLLFFISYQKEHTAFAPVAQNTQGEEIVPPEANPEETETEPIATQPLPERAAETSPLPPPIAKPAVALPPPVTQIPPSIPEPEIVVPAISFTEINTRTRAALVNIICTTKQSGSFEPISGSGVLIDPRGVILTNAHVAQYLLLKDYIVPDYITCTVRAGAPAVNRYKVTLLYLAPQWIERNYKKITESETTGTGEHDFALLLVTESTDPSRPLPDSFPFLSLDTSEKMLRQKNAPVLVAGYPAGFLGGINIQKELFPVSSVAQIEDVYTFKEGTPDVVSIVGSPLGQQGASGGAVVTGEGKLLGIITTASAGETTGERKLNAITGVHLEQSFAERNAFSMLKMFSEVGNVKPLADEFNRDVAPHLTKLLEDALNAN